MAPPPIRELYVTLTRRQIFAPAITMAALTLTAVPVRLRADAATERTELARLIHELEQIERVIQLAESAADSSQRVHFQYDWLRNDLARLKAGIRAYLETVPLTPRTIPPLAGDYIR
jgi:RAQPRD family integrative conjugative element protein